MEMKGTNSKANLEGNAGLQSELESLLLQQQHNRGLVVERETDLDINRSGSAPPTVEGALGAAGSLFRHPNFGIYNSSGSTSNNAASLALLTEEEIRSHPAYLEYYYSHENINPRLPPPVLSKEDWRVAQRLRAAGFDLGGNLADHRGGFPLFSIPPGLPVKKPEDDVMELRKAALRNLSRKNSTESLEKAALMNLSRKNSVESLDKAAALMNLSRKNSIESLDKAAALMNLSRKGSAESLDKAAALMNLSRKNSVESLDKAAALRNLSQKNSVESLEKAAALMNLSRKGSSELLDKASLMNRSQKNSMDLLDNSSHDANMASSSGMGVRRKSFADILQEGLDQPPKSNIVCTSSQNSVADMDSMRISNSQAEDIQAKAESLEAMLPEKTLVALSGTQNNVPANPSSMRSSSVSSLPTMRPELAGRSTSPPSGPVTLGNGVNRSGRINTAAPNFHSSGIFEIADTAAASLSGLNISNGQLHPENIATLLHLGIPMSHQQSLLQHYSNIARAKALADNMNNINLMSSNGLTSGLNIPKPAVYEAVNFPRRTSSSANLQLPQNPSNFTTLEDLKLLCQNNHLADLRSSNQMGLHFPTLDLHQIQYLQRNMAQIPGNSSKGILYASGHHGLEELQALEKAYLEALLLQQTQQYPPHFLPKNGGISHPYPPFPPCVASYQENLALAQNSGINPRGSVNEKSAQMPSALRNLKGDNSGLSHSPAGSNTKGKFESLLETLKNNKNITLELSDIMGHVVEFSMDQFGSRFIQQKLETATDEEKTKVLAEIIPHARGLMVDVFGNYVIQKFFEHGTESQQKELARHMIGHVMPLTLQMYGCRVIQKALEVVDLELQTEMVKELDGSVIKCVYDQNGNHVIQKCIECVPQDRIQFIISSFLGQVVALSTHPYGCRVIQRVLEHCADPKTEEIIMGEIMSSVCKLAQDQYGNYVIQHVVQHGKPHERSMIISKLSGQIVKMSQQKFASNVVEKCLTYCRPEERQLLVNEMLGSTDENEPLQAMMKDPFGNYVVQKVLKTCDDKSRELILSRIKVHLNSLKRYTYGKHIVSRVEKLIATGERHTGQSSSSST